ncbi:MAG: alkaline phosphatase family protein [Rhodococcus sp.]|uniref:alkaline phosphatase family protein n=1 Tax=Rhodococcus TaxID=1827 RepID=UPI0016ABE7EA|nr:MULTISPECIES: nucleotide pyrophosphatase/phosphodiesterase family protein [Rhodococcus]NLV80228.1 alkaline phosphatase family protein [Rhodococcus sp. (in: high G+C Gram-positive bacteria)]
MSVPLRDVYAEPTLADLLPSVLASAGVVGENNRLGLADCTRTVVLLVDGMGWNLLQRNSAAAPFLTQSQGRPIRAGFPTTTAVSIASLGTGLPSGAHGITGYQSYVEEIEGPVNWLRWTLAGTALDRRDELVPEEVQPTPTVFERGVDAGLAVTTVVPRQFDGSGLTRAVLRGGRFAGVSAYGDLFAQVVDAIHADERSLVYCYLGEVDTLGHVYGPESTAWLAQLTIVDRFVEQLAAALPSDARMLVTADHGMVDASRGRRIDFDHTPGLGEDVAVIAGEPRCRHIHTDHPDRVLERWRNELGDDAWVGTRDDVLAAGLFGPMPPTAHASRIGDVVAIGRGESTVVRTDGEWVMARLPGQHGALTDDELLVPLLQVR